MLRICHDVSENAGLWGGDTTFWYLCSKVDAVGCKILG
jgi:hypothetical protein